MPKRNEPKKRAPKIKSSAQFWGSYTRGPVGTNIKGAVSTVAMGLQFVFVMLSHSLLYFLVCLFLLNNIPVVVSRVESMAC